jgi:SAM-dependent methyltransferase
VDIKDGLLDVFSALLPPRQRVLALFTAKWTIGALRPIVELGIPELLAAGPQTAEDLAAATSVDPDALYRVLRCCAAAGIFAETEGRTFAHTPASDALRMDVPDTIRDMFLFASDMMMWRPYEDVLHTVQTGETAFDHVFGMSFFEFLKANPDRSALFDRAMIQNRYPATNQILDEFDFGRFRKIADVGGGKGQFLADILTRFPESTGVLCDLPHVVVDAKPVFEAAGVAERVEIVDTDFFAEVTPGCDAYLIKHAMHNWNDTDAARIARTIRTAIGDDPNARLLIVDMVLTAPGGWDIGKLTDIEMLAALGGRERSADEWHRMLAAEGFEPANDPQPGNLAILEYRAKS